MPVVEHEGAEVVVHQQAPGFGSGGQQPLPGFVGRQRPRRLAELRHQLRQLAPHPVGQLDVGGRLTQGPEQANDGRIWQLGVLRLAGDAQPGPASGGQLAGQAGLAGSGRAMQVDALPARPGGFDLRLRRPPHHEGHDAGQAGSAGGDGSDRRAGLGCGRCDRRRERCGHGTPGVFAQRLRQRLCRRRGLDVELVAQGIGKALVGLQGAGAVAERKPKPHDMHGRRLVQRLERPAAQAQRERLGHLAAILVHLGLPVEGPAVPRSKLVAPVLQPRVELVAADAVEAVEGQAAGLRQALVVDQTEGIDLDALGIENEPAVGGFLERHPELAQAKQLAPQVAPAGSGIDLGP